MTLPKLTPTTYASHNGAYCPACLSPSVTGYSVEITETGAEQKITCDECPATWVDTYRLTGYVGLEIEDPNQ